MRRLTLESPVLPARLRVTATLGQMVKSEKRTTVHAVVPEGVTEELLHAAVDGRLPESERRDNAMHAAAKRPVVTSASLRAGDPNASFALRTKEPVAGQVLRREQQRTRTHPHSCLPACLCRVYIQVLVDRRAGTPSTMSSTTRRSGSRRDSSRPRVKRWRQNKRSWRRHGQGQSTRCTRTSGIWE